MAKKKTPEQEREEELRDGGVATITQDDLDHIGDDRQPGEPLPAKRLTDSEYRERRQEMARLHKDMCDLNDRAEKEDIADLDEQWSRMSDAFDAVKAEVEAHQRWRNASDGRRKRLEAMADSANRLPKAVRHRLVGQSLIDAGSYDADDAFGRQRQNPNALDGAVNAWFKVRNGMPSAITEYERDCCDQLGFSPADRNLWLPMYDAARFQECQKLFLASMDGVHPGQKGYEKARREAQKAIRDSLSKETPDGPLTENYLSGTNFVADLEEAVLAYSGLLNSVYILRTADGNPYYWPTADDTANEGRMIDEALAIPPAAGALIDPDVTPSIGRMVLYAFIGTSDGIPISNSLLEDNQVGLATLLPEMLGTRIGRLKNKKGTIGAGVASSEPDGIVPQSTLGKTAASNAAIVLDEITDLTHAVDPDIRRMHECKFMFTDQTLKLFRKIKDSEGRYLWQVDARSGAPDTLFEYAYVVNQNMAEIGATTKSVIFGNFMSYKWRDVIGSGNQQGIRLAVLRELYAESDQTGYQAFARFDGRLLNPGDNPVVHLIHPA